MTKILALKLQLVVEPFQIKQKKMILKFFIIFAVVKMSLAESRPYYANYFQNENLFDRDQNNYNDNNYSGYNVDDFNPYNFNQNIYPNDFNGNEFDPINFEPGNFDNQIPNESKPQNVPQILQISSGDFSQTSSGTVIGTLVFKNPSKIVFLLFYHLLFFVS